jgi:predicted RNA-binding Zn ribbon-like protein
MVAWHLQPVKCLSMETLEQAGARPLLIVGGNLALDFANTVDDPGGPADFDHLGDAARCLVWARHFGLVDDTAAGGPQAPADLRRLRDALLTGFTAVADDRPFPEPAWHELRRAVAHAVGHADLATVDGRIALRPPAGDLGTVADAVALAAHDLLTGDQLHRVKHCAQCHWVFLDRSKNGSRRWCSMDDCGGAVKMRRYVARRAARRGPA